MAVAFQQDVLRSSCRGLGSRALGEFLWSAYAEVRLMSLNLLIWLVKARLQVSYFAPSQAKKLVESLPQEIKANASKEEAEKIKAALEAAGGTVVLE